MGAFESEKIYGIKIRESANDGSDFANPDADYRLAFLGEDGLWHVKDSAGAVTAPYTGGGGGVTELTRVQITADVTVTATSEATANTVVTAGAFTPDGSTAVDIEFSTPFGITPGTASNVLTFWLYDGASSIGYFGQLMTPAAAALRAPVRIARRITPTAAAHTYSVRCSVNSGTGTVTAGAGGAGNNAPAFIRITEA